jgi:hypothetical protein
LHHTQRINVKTSKSSHNVSNLLTNYSQFWSVIIIMSVAILASMLDSVHPSTDPPFFCFEITTPDNICMLDYPILVLSHHMHKQINLICSVGFERVIIIGNLEYILDWQSIESVTFFRWYLLDRPKKCLFWRKKPKLEFQNTFKHDDKK